VEDNVREDVSTGCPCGEVKASVVGKPKQIAVSQNDNLDTGQSRENLG
jgi:hypothetical protein